MRKTIPAKFVPEFKGPIEGWVTNHLKKNAWRALSRMEYEDLMQEANLVFLKLKRKYPDIETPQHFMALYKTAWTNQFTDFTYLDTKHRVVITDSDLGSEESSFVGALPGDLSHDGMLMTAIRQAPAEVQSVVSIFLNAPAELLELVAGSLGTRRNSKDRGNELLCKMVGVTTDTDLVGMVESYFSPYN